MTPEALAYLVFAFLIAVAVISVVWPWHESGDMIDEVDEEREALDVWGRL